MTDPKKKEDAPAQEAAPADEQAGERITVRPRAVFTVIDSVEGTEPGVDKVYKQQVEVVRVNDSFLGIRLQGHGDCCSNDNEGTPIVLELHNGEFKVHVFADINKEAPTHVISMKNARESARKESCCG